MSKSTPVRIDGLERFQLSVRDLDAGMKAVVHKATGDAAEIVAAEARRRMPVRSGRARASVKVVAGATSAGIQTGGPTAPYVPWLDFGGAVGRRNARGLGSVRRVFVKEGRYVFPAYVAKQAEITELFEKAVDDLARASGLEVD